MLSSYVYRWLVRSLVEGGLCRMKNRIVIDSFYSRWSVEPCGRVPIKVHDKLPAIIVVGHLFELVPISESI